MLTDCVGKEVRGSDGHKLGKCVQCDASELVVESGFFRVDSFAIPVDEVASVSEGELYLRRPAQHYKPDAPHTHDWSPWHSGRRDAEAREELDAVKRADREHRLGAQGVAELSAQARSSVPGRADVLDSERDDRLAHVQGTLEHDPLTPSEPRGSPPEARLPAVPHPEDEPWP